MNIEQRLSRLESIQDQHHKELIKLNNALVEQAKALAKETSSLNKQISRLETTVMSDVHDYRGKADKLFFDAVQYMVKTMEMLEQTEIEVNEKKLKVV